MVIGWLMTEDLLQASFNIEFTIDSGIELDSYTDSKVSRHLIISNEDIVLHAFENNVFIADDEVARKLAVCRGIQLNDTIDGELNVERSLQQVFHR